MISVTKLRNGVYFAQGNTPYKVLEYKHKHLSRGSGTIKVKVRDLESGRLSFFSFKSGEKVDEIVVEKKLMQYLYSEDGGVIMMDRNSYEQVEIEKEVVGEIAPYLKEGESYEVLSWDKGVLGVEVKPKVEMEVVEAAPGERGDSASNVYKDAKLEGGLKIRVPLFVNVGDKIRVDTRSGEYVERV